MVVCCAVANCTSRAKKGSGITFHRFPADKELFAKWVRATGRANYKPSDFAKVCSMHFHKDDMYTDKYNRRFLKKGVVPSRFYIVRKIRRRMKLVFATIPEPSNEVIISNKDTEVIDPNSVQTRRNSSFKTMSKERKPRISEVVVSDGSTKRLDFNTDVAEFGSVFLEDQLHNSQFVESEVVISSEDTGVINSDKGIIPKSNEEESTVSLEAQSHVANSEKNDKNNEATVVIINNLQIPSKLIDQHTEFLKPKTNNDCNEDEQINTLINSDTSTLKPTDLNKPSRSSLCQTNKVDAVKYRKQEIGLADFEKVNIRPINKANKAKKRKFVKRKREIRLEDFEKINDARLADPKVVKQLLTIAYKTIQEQRKIIANWQLKHKNMEKRVVQLHKTLIRLKAGQCM